VLASAGVHSKQTKTAPVVIYIHGGAFIFGSGYPKNLNPLAYTNRDVILVFINYRLNLHGFYSNPALNHQTTGLRFISESNPELCYEFKQESIKCILQKKSLELDWRQ